MKENREVSGKTLTFFYELQLLVLGARVFAEYMKERLGVKNYREDVLITKLAMVEDEKATVEQLEKKELFYFINALNLEWSFNEKYVKTKMATKQNFKKEDVVITGILAHLYKMLRDGNVFPFPDAMLYGYYIAKTEVNYYIDEVILELNLNDDINNLIRYDSIFVAKIGDKIKDYAKEFLKKTGRGEYE